MKLKRLMDQQVARLLQVRGDSQYAHDMKIVLKMLQNDKKVLCPEETEAEISSSFRNALHIRCENEGFQKRLRDSEVQTILNYKEEVNMRRIADFGPAFEVLQKIDWFH